MGKPTHSLRRPKLVPSGLAGQRASGPDGQPASGRKVTQRADGRALRKRTIYFPADVSKRLDMHCTETERDVSEVVVEAVQRLLSG